MKRIVLLSCVLFPLGSWAAQVVVDSSSPSTSHSHRRSTPAQSHHHGRQAVTVPAMPNHHGHRNAAPNTTRTPAYAKKNNTHGQNNRADLHAHGHD
ncbi:MULTISPECIES: hypothetical protein [Legionella]|uniref:Uncharacterized protein n=1 Tax=Legionella maceachernii TaxID=466 RepID=A0A0W0WFM8_9GAMM|nr:hypothetical protein [Legionella maceachernii]KTD31122.1 hypothetical protein Lmac_0425 [Legionella maceachernii]SJZ99237.1 hypothetical protein SAMN02745128_01693 [Legionella maceachernii]SUP01234.1 Uncharacterised protein [Legionella maceachernii]